MRKEKMLKLLGSFLALMLACTILSRASSSVTVAVVETASPGKMALSHRVTAVGKVMENQQQAVLAEAGHRISRVFVREGDGVEKRDVLLQLDTGALREEAASCRRELENLEWEIQELESARNIREEKRNRLLWRAQEDYTLAAAKGDQAVSQAVSELNDAIDRLNAYYNVPAEEKEEGGEQERALADAVDAARKAYEEAVAAREDAILQAGRALEDAREEELPDSTIRQKENEAEEKRKQLRKLKKLLGAEGKVCAPVKGAVTKVNVSAGDWTTEAAPLLLADLSTGCKFLAQVDRGEEKYLEKHAPVTLRNEVKKKKVEDLEIASVEINQEDPSLLDVAIDLPADALEIGDSAEMIVEKKSKTYPVCVPIQALHQADGVNYVYVVGEKETILGKQLTAVKRSVTVQEQNEMYAALADGSLASDEKVIKDSSKAIDEGSPVRLDAS